MCKQGKCCEKPERLKGKPEECSAEQVRKCHGDVKAHPCVPGSKTRLQEGKNR